MTWKQRFDGHSPAKAPDAKQPLPETPKRRRSCNFRFAAYGIQRFERLSPHAISATALRPLNLAATTLLEIFYKFRLGPAQAAVRGIFFLVANCRSECALPGTGVRPIDELC